MNSEVVLDSPNSQFEYVSDRLDFYDLFQFNTQKFIVILVSFVILTILRYYTSRNLVAVVVVIVMIVYHVKRKREYPNVSENEYMNE